MTKNIYYNLDIYVVIYKRNMKKWKLAVESLLSGRCCSDSLLLAALPQTPFAGVKKNMYNRERIKLVSLLLLLLS